MECHKGFASTAPMGIDANAKKHQKITDLQHQNWKSEIGVQPWPVP